MSGAALNVPGAIPDDIVHAAEAAQNRNVAVRTVLEALFRWLQSIDLEAALAWELELVKDKEVDPDLGTGPAASLGAAGLGCQLVALNLPQMPPEIRRCSANGPAVLCRGDRVLRRHALQWIVESETPRELPQSWFARFPCRRSWSCVRLWPWRSKAWVRA